MKSDKQTFKRYLDLLTAYDNQHIVPLVCSQQFSDDKKDKSAWKYLFWTLDDFEKWFPKLDTRNREDRRSVSIAINEFGKNEQPLSGPEFTRTASEVSRIRAFVVDVDTFISRESIAELVEEFNPSFTVISSKKESLYKMHLYYIIKPGSDKFNATILKNYNILQKSLAYGVDTWLAMDKGVKGFNLESYGWCDRSILSDKAMRAPGFLHQKDLDHVFCSKMLEGDFEVTEENFSDFLRTMLVTEQVLLHFKQISTKRHAINSYAGTTGYPGASDGARHVGLFDWVQDLAYNTRLPEACIVAIAHAANEEGNDPPLDPEEVEAIAIGAHQRFRDHCSESLLRSVDKGNYTAVTRLMEIRAEAVRQKLLEEKGSRASETYLEKITNIIDTYKYSNEAYDHVLSDKAIRHRLYDAYGHTLLHNTATGILSYLPTKGVWDPEIGTKIAWERTQDIINNMKYEPIVQQRFPIEEDTRPQEDGVDYDADRLNEYVSRKLDINYINKLVSSIEKDPHFHSSHENFDASVELLNTPAGMVDLVTGKLYGHDPLKYFTAITRGVVDTKLIPELIDLQDTAQWEEHLWSKLVLTYCSGDLELARFLQVLFGMSLFGEVKEQKAPILLGDGANGKSTLLELILHTLGSFGSNAPQTLVVKDKFGKQNQYFDKLAQLRNKRFVAVEDMDQDAVYDESVLKNLTSGGSVTARALAKSNIEFQVRFMLFLQSNHRPNISGTDGGIWRRILAVWFNYSVPEKDQQGNFKTILKNTEGVTDFILNWLVAGSMRYAKEGLIIPVKVSSVTDEYRREQQPLLSFVLDNFSLETDKEAAISNNELFDMYIVWRQFTNPTGIDLPVTSTALARQIRKIIKQTFKYDFNPNDFRTSTIRLQPLRMLNNSFHREFYSDEIQAQLPKLRKEVCNVVDINDTVFGKYKKGNS